VLGREVTYLLQVLKDSLWQLWEEFYGGTGLEAGNQVRDEGGIKWKVE
jgi:hypothetical protein